MPKDIARFVRLKPVPSGYNLDKYLQRAIKHKETNTSNKTERLKSLKIWMMTISSIKLVRLNFDSLLFFGKHWLPFAHRQTCLSYAYCVMNKQSLLYLTRTALKYPALNDGSLAITDSQASFWALSIHWIWPFPHISVLPSSATLTGKLSDLFTTYLNNPYQIVDIK